MSSTSSIRSRADAEQLLRDWPEWYHSIELVPGLFTPGRFTGKDQQSRLARLHLPELHGKSVLDIGAYDGLLSFHCEQHGAARVVALDHYVWSTDMIGYMQDWRTTKEVGDSVPPPHQSKYWQPDRLPGRGPFD